MCVHASDHGYPFILIIILPKRLQYHCLLLVGLVFHEKHFIKNGERMEYNYKTAFP